LWLAPCWGGQIHNKSPKGQTKEKKMKRIYDVTKSLSSAIDWDLDNGIGKEDSLESIADYQATKGNMSASPLQHYQSRIYRHKGNGKSASRKASAMTEEQKEIMRIKAIRLYTNPLQSAEEIGMSQRDFELIFSAFESLEDAGKIEFSGAALDRLSKLEAEKLEAEKEAKKEEAMALLISDGYVIERKFAWHFGSEERKALGY
jgi:hypothetical protein